jgi:hypothetical protein
MHKDVKDASKQSVEVGAVMRSTVDLVAEVSAREAMVATARLLSVKVAEAAMVIDLAVASVARVASLNPALEAGLAADKCHRKT